MPTTYTVVMDEAWAEWVAGVDELQGTVAHLGNGRVRFNETAIAYLRCPRPPLGMYIHVNDDNKLFVDFAFFDLVPDR